MLTGTLSIRSDYLRSRWSFFQGHTIRFPSAQEGFQEFCSFRRLADDPVSCRRARRLTMSLNLRRPSLPLCYWGLDEAPPERNHLIPIFTSRQLLQKLLAELRGVPCHPTQPSGSVSSFNRWARDHSAPSSVRRPAAKSIRRRADPSRGTN